MLDTPSEGMADLLDKCKTLVANSRTKMGEFYNLWDSFDADYRGKTTSDEATSKTEESNSRAIDRDEPRRRKIPLSYAQVDTFVSVGLSLLFQDESLFPLEGTGPEDGPGAKVAQALLERDLDKSMGPVVVEQKLKDIARFGIGILKVCWYEEQVKRTQMVPQDPIDVAGMTEQPAPQPTEVVGYENQYNKLVNISPYKFFPDVRLPIRRFQDGEFCACEEEHTRAELLRMEQNGQVVGVEYVAPLTFDTLDNRGSTRLSVGNWVQGGRPSGKTLGIDVWTEVQIMLVPSEYIMADGQPLGPETTPVRYNVLIVNDNRIVKLEPLNYPLDMFTYSVGLYNPDIHYLTSEGLVEMVTHIQSLHNWFINAHITSVRKIIDNKLFVDPSAFEIDDLRQRKPVVRMKASVQGQDIRKFIHQLDLQDVTRQHVGDAAILHDHMKQISGINENMLGVTSEGRRSATEKRAANTAALGRIKKTISGIYLLGLKPAAEQMLANHRAFLEAPTYVRVLGDMANPMNFIMFKEVTGGDIQGNYDFKMFDPTSPSDRYMTANSLMELLQLWMTNPLMMQLLPLDPTKLVFEIFRLRGVRNLERFFMNPQQMMQFQQQLMLQNAGQQQQPGQPTGQRPSGENVNPAGGAPSPVLDLANLLAQGAAGGAPARSAG